MVYLDYAATAIPYIYVSDYTDKWFNPNSTYAVDEKKEFIRYEERVKTAIGADSGKVIFGGNASWFFKKLFNLQENFWLCGLYEHDCVYKDGVETKIEELDKIHLGNEIYCHQFVNNITGEIFSVDEIGRKVKNNYGYFVCDATAGIGKAVIPDNIEDWCDCLVCSSHKLGVDNKQIGFAWLSDRFADWLGLNGSVVNGYGLIDGTPDLACARAATNAVVYACKQVSEYNYHCDDLFRCFNNKLMDANIIYEYITPMEDYTNTINAITLQNINADALCNYLSTVHKIYISPGHSACEDNSDYRVLKNYGLNQEQCESTIRVSFSSKTTESDIDALVSGIIEFKNKFGGQNEGN